MTIFLGLQMCVVMDILHLQVESNCILMIDMCNEEAPCNSRFGILVSKIWSLKHCFDSSTLHYDRRNRNVLVYLLACHEWHLQTIII